MGVFQNRDHELIRRDKALIGLSLLLEPQQLREALSRHWDSSSLDDIKLSYVRYKPGMNCLGRYELQVAGKIHLAYAKTFTADAASKLAKAQQSKSTIGPLGAGLLVFPESNLFVSFFPNDQKLSNISKFANPLSCSRLLHRIFEKGDEWEGCERSVLNYKPERRLVLRLVRPDGQAATVKFYTPREFSRITRPKKMEIRGLGLDGATVLRPERIGYSKRHGVMAFSWISGETLRDRVQDFNCMKSHFRDSGRLLAGFHGSSGQGLKPHDQSTQIQAVESMAMQLAHLLPELRERALDVATDLQNFLANSATELCPVHGDFYDKQIIVGANGLSLIDFDRVHLGQACEDMGCFLAHQERLAIKNPDTREQNSSFSAAFLDGYMESGGRCNEKQLAIWTALYLFRLSHHPFRDRDPDWPSQTANILQRVSDLLPASQKHRPLAQRTNP